MYQYLKKRRDLRKKRALRVRKYVKGTSLKPRLSVFKSNKHLFAQLIDDVTGETLVSYGTRSKDSALADKNKTDAAKVIGTKIGELAKTKNIQTVVFDRGYSKYHGVIAQLADAARTAGLKF